MSPFDFSMYVPRRQTMRGDFDFFFGFFCRSQGGQLLGRGGAPGAMGSGSRPGALNVSGDGGANGAGSRGVR